MTIAKTLCLFNLFFLLFSYFMFIMANGNNQITVLLISKIHKPIQGGIFININIFLTSMANKFSEKGFVV